MSEDQPDTPVTDCPEFLSGTWGELVWTGWFSFAAMKQEFRIIPSEPGLYRIRALGSSNLLYIGETRRPLYELLNGLRQSLRNRDLMPWSDPFTEAPALWALQDSEEISFECSAAPLDASQSGRRGMESYLLAKYREEAGESPICNFNRFPARYRRSTIRGEGLRGGKLAENQQDNPASLPGSPPLPVIGLPGEPDWMGLVWSEWLPANSPAGTFSHGSGLYLVIDSGSQEILVIGQSPDCAERLKEFSIEKSSRELQFSCVRFPGPVPAHILKEQANDLLGNYFGVFRKVPAWQFGRPD